MSTYTYKCGACEEQYEVIQSIHDDPLTKCEKCKKGKVSRVIVPGPSFRIGGLGVHKPTAHWKVDTKSFKRVTKT